MDWCEFGLNFLSTAVGAGIGVLGAYRIYRCQLKKDKEKENRVKNNQDIELLKYFHTLLTQIVATVNTRKKLFTDYIQKQNKNFAELTPMLSVSNNDFIRAKNLDDSALFNAWMNQINIQDKLKKYLTLQAELDYIEGAIANMDSIYNENSKKGFAILSEVNKTLQRFIFNLNTFISKIESSPLSKSLSTLLSEHLHRTYENRETPENYTLNDVKNSFITPLITVINQNIFNYPEDLTLLIGEMMSGFREVEMQTKHVLEQIEYTWEEIDNHINNTNELIKHLESFK